MRKINKQVTMTKITKVGELMPPREIRDNTKARRAWVDAIIAAQEAPIVATSVGGGSYQKVVLHKHEQVPAREQLRGVCQVCGCEQAADKAGAPIALHGYNRPRWGYVVGRCSGTGYQPAEKDISIAKVTEQHLVKEIARLTPIVAANRELPYHQQTKDMHQQSNTLWGMQQHLVVVRTIILPRFGQDLRVELMPS